MKEKINQVKEMYKLSGYHKQFFILFTIIVSAAIIEILAIPHLTRKMVDVYIPASNINALIIWGCIYSIFLFLSCCVTLKHCNMRSILKRKIQKDLREKIFCKMQEVNAKFYDEHDTGVLLQFLQADVKESGAMFAEIVTEMCFMGLIRFGIIAIFLMFIDLRITLAIIVLYIIGYFITIYFNKQTILIVNEIRKINIELYSEINESVQGFLTIKVLNIIEKKEEELQKLLKEYTLASKQLEKKVSIYNNVFAFIISISLAIIICFAGIEVACGVMSYVEIMLLIEYNSSLGFEFDWFIKHLTNFNKSFIAFSKILRFLNLESTEKLEEGDTLDKIDSIEFSKVFFSYTGVKHNIEEFEFKLNKNEKLALIGRTGSGKTTVVNLICRFYEPTAGEILINGRDYLTYSIKSLREKIGYVMQDTYILSNTIIDNIRCVNENITEADIHRIFKKLKLHDKIMSFEKGYYTDIYNNPDILSTGEKQMINFARVMAINCDLVILDEVTSDLSYENEMLVNNAIKEVAKNKMVIIITHRLSIVKACDKVILMQDGRQVEQAIDRKTVT